MPDADRARRPLGGLFVVIVFVLSAVFLGERVDLVSAAGLAFTVGGVALLAFRT